MLAKTPSEWMVEIRADEEERDKIVERGRQMVGRFHGRAYAGGGYGDEGNENPEGHAFKMVSSLLPLLAYSKPKVTVGSQRHGPAQEWTKAIQHGLNRWIALTDFETLSEKLATDYCFTWGATLTSVQVRPGFEEAEDPPMWPQVARLSPSQFGFDRLAYSFEEARYIWHKVVIDRDELLDQTEADQDAPEDDREGWNLEGVRALVASAGVGATRPNQEVRKDEVSYYEVWSPSSELDEGHTSEDGYHGKIYRFSETGDGGVELCKPFDYWGPRWGPYTLYGCFRVPDKPWPLSVLLATYDEEVELNSVALANNDNARRYKRFVAADDADFIELIKDGEHDHAYYHANLVASKMETAEIGGLNDQGIAQEARLRDSLERKSGMTEAEQGVITGGTATETSIVTSAVNKRQAYYVRKFAKPTTRMFETVAWYLANNDHIVYELGDEAVAETGMEAPVFEGGPSMDEVGMYDNIEVEIDVRSMGHRSQQEDAQDAMNKLTMVAELANLAVNSPVRVGPLATQIGEKMGWPDLPDLIDLELAAEMRAQMAEAAAGGPGGGQGGGAPQFTPPPQPRLGITTVGGAAGKKAASSTPKPMQAGAA